MGMGIQKGLKNRIQKEIQKGSKRGTKMGYKYFYNNVVGMLVTKKYFENSNIQLHYVHVTHCIKQSWASKRDSKMGSRRRSNKGIKRGPKGDPKGDLKEDTSWWAMGMLLTEIYYYFENRIFKY